MVLGFSGKIYPIDMDACVYIPTYTQYTHTHIIHIDIHTFTHTHIPTHILTYIHTYTCIHACIHTYDNVSIDTVLPVWHSLTQKGMPCKARSL